MKATKRLLYAHWSVWAPLAKEVLGSQIASGCCQSPPHKGLQFDSSPVDKSLVASSESDEDA